MMFDSESRDKLLEAYANEVHGVLYRLMPETNATYKTYEIGVRIHDRVARVLIQFSKKEMRASCRNVS